MFKHGFPPEWSTFKKLIWLVGSGIAGAAAGVWKTVSGTLLHLTDALASPMQKCEVTLEPIQAGSGDPSPTNVRPITGWTGCEVTRTGKNLANDAEFSIEKPSWSTAQYWLGLSKNADGTFTLTRPIGWGGYGFVYVGTYKAGTYKLSFDLISTADVNCAATCAIKKKGTWTEGAQVGTIIGLTVAGRYSLNDFTITEDCDVWLAVGPYIDNESQVISGNYQLELGSTATTYEPYSGTTLSVTFPDGQTVYGGKYDFISGGLKPYKEYDSYNGETLTGRWMSSMDKYVAGTTPTIGAQVVDLDGFETTVQLIPQPISTLAGENNVWSNGNSVEITYKAQSS